MKNLAYLLLTDNAKTMTYNGDLNELFKTEASIHGENVILSMCMEECAELIEVITENRVQGKVKYIDLMDELADCQLSIHRLMSMFNASANSFKYYLGEGLRSSVQYSQYDRETLIDNCILNLSSVITLLSKYIRKKANSDKNIVKAIHALQETFFNIYEYYELDLSILKSVYQLKLLRTDSRNKDTLSGEVNKDTEILTQSETQEE